MVEDIFPSNFIFFCCSPFSLKIPLDYLEKQNLKSEQSECSLNQWVGDSHEKALKKEKHHFLSSVPEIECLNPRGSKLILPPLFFFIWMGTSLCAYMYACVCGYLFKHYFKLSLKVWTLRTNICMQ